MGTVSKRLADEIVEGDGYYMDDPRVFRIIQYTNVFGPEPSFGLEHADEIGKYTESVYVQNPRIYWEAS